MKVKIVIDDIEYEVEEGKNLLETVLSLGMNLPYFCWHPSLHSVGACRQCSVLKFKDAQDAKGKLVVACMEPVMSGVRISIEAPLARQFRANVVESLMLNHPHDCPVCDEGGECHLQDMTVMTGHNYRRSTFKKRTFMNQDLGPFVNHEMNRCIECYRCVRFYKEYADGKDLDVFASHDHVYFGRAEDGTLENEFSGNLIEVCPTGVFTDKTLKKHYTRKWDLSSAASVCHGCSLGCNIFISERYGEVRRVLNRYSNEINGYFICDRGRFGYEYINSKDRLRFPRCNNQAIKEDKTVHGNAFHSEFKAIKSVLSNSKKVIGIGSPKASLESNYALRSLVGAANFYAGISKVEFRVVQKVIDILKAGKAANPTLKEVESYDAVLVLGEDVTNTAPMLALALRQAAKNKGRELAHAQRVPIWDDAAVRLASQETRGPFYLASVSVTRLDDIASQVHRASPDDIARFGQAIAHYINPRLPAVELKGKAQAIAQAIASDLLLAKKPLIVSGTSLYSEVILQSADEICSALIDSSRDAGAVYVVPDANSIGLLSLVSEDMEDAFQAARQGADTVLVLENDLYYRFSPEKIATLLEKNRHSIAFSSHENRTTQRASYVLPSATFAEADGTVVNNEGRAQRFYASYSIPAPVRSSWMWLNALRGRAEQRFDELIEEMVLEFPALCGVRNAAPSASYRKGTQRIPREPHRYSGRTSMHAERKVDETQEPQDAHSPLSFTMEGYQGQAPASIIPFIWSPGWNSVQGLNKFQAEIAGPLREGHSGVRIFDPPVIEKEKGMDEQYNVECMVPPEFIPKDQKWLVVPLYHIFGSEELTAKGAAIQARIPEPYVAVNLDDAARLGLSDGSYVELDTGDKVLKLIVNIQLSIPLGIIGLPFGLDATKGIEYPLNASLKRM